MKNSNHNKEAHASIPMKNINREKSHVSIPGVECGIALMPMKEFYQMMYDDVVTAQISLATASSAKEIRHILQEIYQYPVDNRVSEQIRYMVKDIKGNVRAMHTNDYTRDQMLLDLTTLLSALLNAIEEEEHEEDIEDARRTFLFMADHAEEFVNWVKEIRQKQ